MMIREQSPMLRRMFCLILLVGGMLGIARAALGDWKTYTAKRTVRALAFDPIRSTVWAATSGGLFSYQIPDGAFTEYTTSEGLQTIDLSCVALDDRGDVWIGATNGFIHRYNFLRNEWQYITDIAERSEPQKTINRLQVVGDTLFVLSDIGLSLFSISRMEFISTYMRFGSAGQTQLVGNGIATTVIYGFRWVGTRNGVVSTPLTNPNPSAPESWQIYTTAQGLPSSTITGLASMADSLYAATASGLSLYDPLASSWHVVPQTSGLSIVDVVADTARGTLYFVTSSELWEAVPPFTANSGVNRIANSFPSPLTSIVSNSILGTATGGILLKSDTIWTPTAPTGPPSNRFVGIAIDRRGVVWAGTGSSEGSQGFMSFDGNRWRSYNVSQYPQFRYDAFYKVSIGSSNAKWVGNWGGGVALLNDTGALVQVFNTTNGLEPSLANDSTYVVVGGVATDRDGVAWITNRTPPNDIAVVLFKPDSAFDYSVSMNLRQPTTIFTDVVIDQNGTKWFCNFNRFESVLPSALYYYNERYSLPGTANGWGRLTTADDLTSNQIWSLAVDRTGELWIGSDQGITIVYDPANPHGAILPYHPLRDQVIQAITVDPLNNKWVATKQGVFVLSSDGTVVLNQYTVENTNGKLVDNDITSIAINEQTGIIYFGTEKGLSTLHTSAIEPNRTFENGIAVSPNPYYLPATTPAIIDGLMAGSSLKILTVDGALVRDIVTPGGRIGYWDGTNNRGELVASAVYVVVAYAEDGSKVATGKIAVVRR